MNKKNIAIIIRSLSGGGAERVACILSQYLVQKKHNVYLMVEKYDKRTAYPHSGEIIYTMIGTGSDSKKEQIISLLKRAIELRALKQKYKIDAAISFMEESNYINILSKGREKVIARVCTILSERKKEFSSRIVYDNRLLHYIYNHADNIVVMSRYARNDLIRNWKVSERKIKIIGNPLDFNYIYSCAKQPIAWDYGENVILSVNRLEFVKRQWHLIKAFSEVVKQIPTAKLLFVGDGVCKNRLKAVTKKYNLQDNVIFIGHQNNVYPYMKKSKCFVLTSKTEGFPNGMMESLYVGIPVISVDCPGATKEILANKYTKTNIKSIKHAKYGILVSNIPDCEDDFLCSEEQILANAIIEVLSNQRIYNYYYHCATKYIKHYSMENIGKKWDTILQI